MSATTAKTREQQILEIAAAEKLLIKSGGDSTINLLYTPHSKLAVYIRTFEKNLAQGNKSKSELGFMLEQIALLVFEGLAGLDSVKSYQSTAPQHDLLVNGSDGVWAVVAGKLYFPHSTMGILVESKATRSRVGDKEFERLAGILSHHLTSTAGMGVFVALAGASGFPDTTTGKPVRKLYAARFTQAVVYHSTKKAILVLDWNDIKQLTTAGSLVRTLIRKRRELEEQTGILATAAPMEVVLPSHLAKVSRFKK